MGNLNLDTSFYKKKQSSFSHSSYDPKKYIASWALDFNRKTFDFYFRCAQNWISSFSEEVQSFSVKIPDHQEETIIMGELSFLFYEYYLAEERAEFAFGDKALSKVLLVEDDLINQKVVQTILKKLGFLVDIASNGKEALELSKAHYDIIFMDIGLPDMDGYQVAKKIRSRHDEGATVPIIAVTAQENAKGKRFLKSGLSELITKPVNRKDLSVLLRKMMGK